MSSLPIHFVSGSSTAQLLAEMQAFLQLPQLQEHRHCGFLVACSGGSDSCALLWAAAHAAVVEGIRLEVVTVDHGIRPASSHDADFVEALCARLGLICHRGRLEMPVNAGENELREARYAVFDNCMRKRNLGALLLGHTAEDQAETVLLHLLRGTGLRGLGAMRGIDGVRLRPFLERNKEELRAFLRDLGETWCEDESNEHDRYLRNRVRRGLLLWMQQENPRIVESLCRTARLARCEHDAVVEFAQRRLSSSRVQVFAGRVEALRLADWLQDPEGVRLVVLRRWWRYLAPAGAELPASQVEAVYRDLVNNGVCMRDLPGPVRLTADHGWIVLSVPGSVPNIHVTFKVLPHGIEHTQNNESVDLVPDAQGDIVLPMVAFPLTLRPPAPGDRYRQAPETLVRCKKRLERLPRGLRPHAWVFADSYGVVWWQMFVSEPRELPDGTSRFHLKFAGQRVPVRLPDTL